MNKEQHINKLIEETLNSADDLTRAEPKPYLLTRINARLSKGTDSLWEKASWFVTRPAVAFTGLCMVLLVNAIVLISNKAATPVAATEQVAQNSTDEFSYTVATIYDNDNNTP